MAEKKIARKQPNAIQRYITETRGELRKVTWPTRKEATNLTIIVLAVMAGMTVFLGSLDILFGWLLSLVVGG